jgi:hypothetical protein
MQYIFNNQLEFYNENTLLHNIVFSYYDLSLSLFNTLEAGCIMTIDTEEYRLILWSIFGIISFTIFFLKPLSSIIKSLA